MKRALIAAAALFAASAACIAQVEYECIVVDAFATAQASRQTTLFDINETGVACGFTTIAVTTGGSTSAFLADFYWTLKGGKVAIPHNVQTASSNSGINNLSQFVGRDFRYDIAGGQFATLPSLPPFSRAPVVYSINDGGVVVGHIQTQSSNSNGMFQVPYVWDPVNGARTITLPNAKSANRVNAAGIVVGEMKQAAGVPEGFVYDLNSGVTTFLSPLFPPAPPFELRTRPTDISDEGVVVGEYSSPHTGYSYRGFLWSPAGGLALLPSPAPGTPIDLRPASINGAGVVVGQHGYFISESRAFVWDPIRGIRDLNTIASSIPSGFVLRRAMRINDQGWIVGNGNGGGGFSKGFVLRPVATPCYANCDGSTLTPLLTANDFVCFINAYASGAAYANCDGSTGTPVLTANDFVCFVNRYAAGCP